MRIEVRPWMVGVLALVAVVNLMLTAAIGYYANHASNTADSNTITISQLQQEFLAQQAQSGAFETFLKKFVAENNYSCATLDQLARKYGFTFADAGTCSVVAP